jgi:hypothetical protein
LGGVGGVVDVPPDGSYIIEFGDIILGNVAEDKNVVSKLGGFPVFEFW